MALRRRPINPQNVDDFSARQTAVAQIMRDQALQVTYRSPGELKAAKRNARIHSAKQLKAIAESIRNFGFLVPVLVDSTDTLIVGHGRVAAAKQIGLATIPVIQVDDLTPEKARAFMIADNRLAELAGWDDETLALELQELTELKLDFPVEIVGFATEEIDALIEGLEEASGTEVDEVPEPPDAGQVVTRLGDVWYLGSHRIACGDALNADVVEGLLAGEKAAMAFIDPPFNVPIPGHVSGLGKHKHENFAYACGEMSSEEFTRFLQSSFEVIVKNAVDGAVCYIVMDWRHVSEILSAGRAAFAKQLQLVVWGKTNAGLGTFYRSQHELIFIFKVGTAPHQNHFSLGENGRYRSNLWRYPGANTFREGRGEDLRDHPTVKPVELVADAMRDCSRRGEIVLDTFAGSGTTILAAEKTGRCGYVVEIDPAYVDVAIRRWEKIAGRTAILAATGQTFEEVRLERAKGVLGGGA